MYLVQTLQQKAPIKGHLHKHLKTFWAASSNGKALNPALLLTESISNRKEGFHSLPSSKAQFFYYLAMWEWAGSHDLQDSNSCSKSKKMYTD